MKKQFIQLKTSFFDLLDLIKRFKKRLFKFFGLDKLLKVKIVVYLIKYIKIFIKLAILFKISLILIAFFDNNLYLNLMGVLSSLYFLLRDDLFNKIKDYILDKLDINTLKVKDDFVREVQKLNKDVDKINEIESRHKKLNDKYVNDLKVKEQQMFQDYQNRLTQLKNKYNHLSIKYTEPSAWSDWWNKEKWNILFYSSIIIVTIGIGYYAYTNLDSITNYIKSIFYMYVIKTPYDFITDKCYQSYQYIKSFFTFSGRDIPKPDLEDDDDKSIELNYGKSIPELQEAEETEAWRKGKSPNYDGLLNSDSGSDSDSKAKKLTNIFFKGDESDDSDSTISEHSSTSSSGSSTVKGVNIMDDNVDSDSGSDDDYITPPPSMHNSFRNVAPGISRNTSLMSTSIWGDRLDFSSLDKSMSSMDSTDQWTQSNDTSSSSSDSQNVSSSSSDSQSDSMTSSESKNEGESSNKPLNKNDNNKNNNEQHYVDIY